MSKHSSTMIEVQVDGFSASVGSRDDDHRHHGVCGVVADEEEPWKRSRDGSNPPSRSPHLNGHHDHHPRRESSRLCGILYRNLESDGHRDLLPYLTTTDLLRLSECSKSLSQYRTFISRVKVVWHPWASFWLTARLKQGLVRLLEVQQQPVEVLRLADRSVLPLLEDLAAAGCIEKVRGLDLSHLHLTTKDAACVGRALSQGGMRRLEQLKVSSVSSRRQGPTRLGYIIEAISRGDCPRLRVLDLSCNVWAPGSHHPIATALRSGFCRGLEELDLGYAMEMQGGWMVPIARSLHACPRLRKLVLSSSHLMAGDGHALGVALLAGSCPGLEKLRLSSNPGLGDIGVASVLEALEGGACEGLLCLDLGHLQVGVTGGLALAYALASQNLHHLQYLDMSDFCNDATAVMQIMEALKQRVCPSLRWLSLAESRANMWQGLSEALESLGCPLLEVLVLSGSKSMGDHGVAQLSRALEMASCPRLQELHLSYVGIGESGGQALASALASGSLRHLERLHVSCNRALGDQAMASLFRALSSGSCPNLKVLNARGSLFSTRGGQAFLEALASGAWPHLEEVGIDSECQTPEWVYGLADVLRSPSPRVGKRVKSLGLVSFCRDMGGFLRLAEVLQERDVCPSLVKLSLGVGSLIKRSALKLVAGQMQRAIERQRRKLDVRIHRVSAAFL